MLSFSGIKVAQDSPSIQEKHSTEMLPVTEMGEAQDNSGTLEKPSPEIKSLKGWMVKHILYGISGVSFTISGYEVVAGGLTAGNIVQGIAKGGDYLAIAGCTATIGVASLILGCCSRRWIAEKKIESNVEKLDDLSKVDQVKDLKTQVAELHATIQEYKNQIIELNQFNSKLQGRYDEDVKELESSRKGMKGILVDKEASINKLKDDVGDIREENIKLKRLTRAIQKDNQSLKLQLTHLEKERGDVIIQIEKYRGENKELKGVVEDFKNENSKLHEMCDKSLVEIKDLRRSMNEMNNGRKDLISKLEQLTLDKEELVEANSKLEQTQLREMQLTNSINEILSKLEGLTELQEEFQPLIDALKGCKSP